MRTAPSGAPAGARPALEWHILPVLRPYNSQMEPFGVKGVIHSLLSASCHKSHICHIGYGEVSAKVQWSEMSTAILWITLGICE